MRSGQNDLGSNTTLTDADAADALTGSKGTC